MSIEEVLCAIRGTGRKRTARIILVMTGVLLAWIPFLLAWLCLLMIIGMNEGMKGIRPP